jgi:tagatose-1,6-bisphosphate aldolase
MRHQPVAMPFAIVATQCGQPKSQETESRPLRSRISVRANDRFHSLIPPAGQNRRKSICTFFPAAARAPGAAKHRSRSFNECCGANVTSLPVPTYLEGSFPSSKSATTSKATGAAHSPTTSGPSCFILLESAGFDHLVAAFPNHAVFAGRKNMSRRLVFTLSGLK